MSRFSLATMAVLALTAFATPTAAQDGSADARFLDVSSFMMPPKHTWAVIPPSASPEVVITEKSAAKGDLGFRILHLRASVKARKQAAIDLARSGLVRSGDILLSFRPLWDKTLAYAHMQLGVSHSALAFVVSEGGERFVMTVESPISYSSPLNAQEHYADLDAIHVVRPHLSEAQVSNLEKWARLILSDPSRYSFFSDYSLPMYKRGLAGVTSPKDVIVRLAEVAKGTAPAPFISYCSEFVWSLLGLRNCDPSAFGRPCVAPIFDTGDGMLTGLAPGLAGDAGLIQGPEAALAVGLTDKAERTNVLTESVFVDVLKDPSALAGRMSAGHRKVAEDSKEGMKLVNGYYMGGEPAVLAQAINASLHDNVSPTSFLIRSNAGIDGFLYVGTIVFDR